jgi:dihydroorotate dehydrogenase (NAD+) catalytic subunit
LDVLPSVVVYGRAAYLPFNLSTFPSNLATNLTTNLAGLDLRNPVLLAAGTAGTLDEMSDVLDLSRIGGLITKSITKQPREGNATWRILPADVGMLNAIGLANVGIEAFVSEYLPRIAEVPCPVIGSIAGFSIDDYVSVAAAMNNAPAIRAVELNVSCPNVHAGCEFGADPALLADLIREVRAVLDRTALFVKLSPIAVAVGAGVGGSAGKVGIVEIAKVAIDPGNSKPAGPNLRPGADALCLTNTIPAMAIDIRTRKPLLANVTGGLSGPALHPIAVKIVHDVYRGIAKATKTQLIGIGGVMRWQHAAEFILAGATAVEMGTAVFADPRSPLKVVKGLEKWVSEQGVGRIGDLVGKLDC